MTLKPNSSTQASRSSPPSDPAEEAAASPLLSAEEAEGPLSFAERRLLLQEIERSVLILTRDCGATPPVGLALSDAPGIVTGPRERLHLILTLWPTIRQALAALLRNPDAQLRFDPIPTPLSQARGGSETLSLLARTPNLQSLLRGEVETQEHRISEHRAVIADDTPGMRYAASLVRSLQREAVALTDLFAWSREEVERQEAQGLATEIGRWKRRPLSALPEPTPSDRLRLRRLSSTQCSPPLGALLAADRALRQHLRLDWANSPLLHRSTLASWHLYEIWCALTVAVTLAEMGWRVLENSLISPSPNGLRLGLPAGRSARIRLVRPKGKRRLRSAEEAALLLLYRPVFSSANQSSVISKESPGAASNIVTVPSYRSLTHAMQPDLALEWGGRLYLLDAKYRDYRLSSDPSEEDQSSASWRTDGSLLEDLDKMHAYRDAIVRGDRRAVRAAWCLFPGGPEPEDEIAAYPRSSPELPFGNADLGAIRLRPGGGRQVLTHLLASWLG